MRDIAGGEFIYVQGEAERFDVHKGVATFDILIEGKLSSFLHSNL